jgi:hypothetical protein
MRSRHCEDFTSSAIDTHRYFAYFMDSFALDSPQVPRSSFAAAAPHLVAPCSEIVQ